MKKTMKNKANNKILESQSDLLPPLKSAKPIASSFATCEQLLAAHPFLEGQIDEAFLRNRAREINPRTGAPWIPKPRVNQYDIQPTLIGLLEWFAAKSTATGELPGSYDSMQAMENALGTDKRAIKWLLKNGAGEAQLTGSRIAPLPVMRRAFDVIAQVADGKVTGIDGGEQINTNIELGKKLREERFKAERENALAERRIHSVNEVIELTRTEMLSPVFNELTRLEKKLHRYKFTQDICMEVCKELLRVRELVRQKIAEASAHRNQNEK